MLNSIIFDRHTAIQVGRGETSIYGNALTIPHSTHTHTHMHIHILRSTLTHPSPISDLIDGGGSDVMISHYTTNVSTL
jgi:hypothetical protein